jgi:hypothetical protein
MPAAPEDIQLPAGAEAPGANSGAYLPAGEATVVQLPGGSLEYTAPRPYSPPRPPIYARNASNPQNPQRSGEPATHPVGESGLIGPVGYDVQ